MIKNFFITGDTHSGFNTMTRVNNIIQNNPELKSEETGIIVLGDCSLNFYLNKTDKKYKMMLNNMGYHIYCVRGNHEQRPEYIPSMIKVYDPEVKGEVYKEPEYPYIHYLLDGGIYDFDGSKTLVLGGAYSVDKEYRLARGDHWFPDEQLSFQERKEIMDNIVEQHFDVILSHTCPYSLRPTDLFLRGLDQSKVDNTMEVWLEQVREAVSYDRWFWGHYHANRRIGDKHFMLFEGMIRL